MHVLKAKGLALALDYPVLGPILAPVRCLATMPAIAPALTADGYPLCFERQGDLEGDLAEDSEDEEPSSEIEDDEDATRLIAVIATARCITAGCFRVACVRPGFMLPMR